jgi:hypothetical protein
VQLCTMYESAYVACLGGGEKRTRKHALTVTVIIAIAAVMIFAGVAYAKQTSSSTTQSTAPAQQTTQGTGPSVGKYPPMCEKGGAQHEFRTWFRQLPQEQRSALRQEQQHTFKEWFAQVPQDLKDKMPQDLRDTLNERLSRVV